MLKYITEDEYKKLLGADSIPDNFDNLVIEASNYINYKTFGRIDENNNLIVDAGIDLENQYFTAVVSVALNGIDGAVEWLKIGSIKLYFNSKSTYFLPNNNQSAYSIFTSSKISEQNDETYLRFIKYKEGTSAVTISPISLFAGHSLNVENAGVTSNNLNNYYLQEAGKYIPCAAWPEALRGGNKMLSGLKPQAVP